MKVREILNTSGKELEVQLEDGSVTLAPGCGTRNVRVSESELARVRQTATVRLDLTEVRGHLD